MIVNDGGSELTQGTWYSRLARERLNLSVSVEETLVRPRREQRTWQEEFNEQTNGVRTTHGRLLFPPRLSLQSRPFPAVDSIGSTRVGRAGMSDGLQSTAPDLTVLMRFAQRLTSSFAALEITEPACDDFPFLASDPDAFQPSRETCGATTAPFSLESLGVTRPLPPVPSFTKRLQSVPGKQRLAGCAVRVRLETAPMPIAASTLEQACVAPHTPVVEYLMDSGLGATSAHLPIISNTYDEGSHTSAHLPIADLLPASGGSTSAPLPVPERSEVSRKQPTQRSFSGCSAFDSGQSDVIVANPAITPASVVLVTLTENPGPVVLQYVSLQPGIGFTLHLTAPAVRKTAFNYIILVGELFQDLG